MAAHAWHCWSAVATSGTAVLSIPRSVNCCFEQHLTVAHQRIQWRLELIAQIEQQGALGVACLLGGLFGQAQDLLALVLLCQLLVQGALGLQQSLGALGNSLA
ncbi:MAG: hypothetical protein FJZ47_15640 [Candidatus Tectomicrobia bacterium]|uniref:Uncharacterized protein n=1 Tax=Tectimicrobiota bacterium TaxID=2528274 RepID=A0A937W1P0_UNCTE|nr:hypothetical protein [Candidatus Tectomicrobia bacterium]